MNPDIQTNSLGEFDFGLFAHFEKASKDQIPDDVDREKFYFVHGIFSAETKDLEGETLDHDGVDEGLRKFFKPLNAQIDWEHKYRETKEPKYLIGECFSFKPTFIVKDGKKYRAHYGIFGIYNDPKKEVAADVIKHIEAGGKLGASVDGSRLEAMDENGKTNKVAIVRISLTPNPVNTETFMRKYDAFVKAITTSSSAPMVPEDLEGTAKLVREDIKTLRETFQGLQMSESEIRKQLAKHFGEYIAKGVVTMDDLTKSIDALNESAETLLAEPDADTDGKTKEEKSLLMKAVDGLNDFVKSLSKAEDGDEEEASKEDEMEDEEENDEGYNAAVKSFSSLSRASMLKMCKMGGYEHDMKGKNTKDTVAALTTRLGKGGFAKMVKDSQIDKSLALEDEVLLKSFEAENANENEDDQFFAVGDTPTYEELTKSIDLLGKGRNEDRMALAVLCKAVAGMAKRQDEQTRFMAALCKGMNLVAPATQLAPSSVKADGRDDQLHKSIPDGLHDPNVVMKAITENIQGDNALAAGDVALAKNLTKYSQPLPAHIETVLFPTQ